MSFAFGLGSTAAVSPTQRVTDVTSDLTRFASDKKANRLAAQAQAGDLPERGLYGKGRFIIRPAGDSTIIAGTVAGYDRQAWSIKDAIFDGVLAVQPWLKGMQPESLGASIDAALAGPVFADQLRWGARIAMSQVTSLGCIHAPSARMVVQPLGTSPKAMTAIAAHIPGIWVPADQIWQGMVVALPTRKNDVTLPKGFDAALASDAFRNVI